MSDANLLAFGCAVSGFNMISRRRAMALVNLFGGIATDSGEPSG